MRLADLPLKATADDFVQCYVDEVRAERNVGQSLMMLIPNDAMRSEVVRRINELTAAGKIPLPPQYP